MATTQLKTYTEITFLAFLAGVAGVAFAFYTVNRPRATSASFPVVPAPQIAPSISPTPTATPAPQSQKFSQLSPDGTKQLTLTVTQTNSPGTSFVFVTANADGGDQKTIYSQTYTEGTMNIPFNTWSPNNKYIFVTHTSPAGTEAIVLAANGDPLGDAQEINVTTQFEARSTGRIYDETTGWASDTLLIVNTKDPAGAKSASYWFEVPSKALIPLSTVF